MSIKCKAWVYSIGLVFVLELLIFLYLTYFQIDVLLYLLPVMLLLPIMLVYKNAKSLINKYEVLKISSTDLAYQVTDLEEKNTTLQFRENVFSELIQGMDTLVFLYNISENSWTFFNKFHEYKTSQGIRMIEDLLHPADRRHFQHKKEEWLTGTATKVEFRVVLEDGQIRWKELRTNSKVTSTGTTETVLGLVIDITEMKQKEETLKQMAYYDSLTDLPNRTMLKTHLRKVLSRAERKEHDFVVMFIDLDGFKEVNDNLGHDLGDALLKQVANRLKESVREEDLISRIGGDEFILVFEETSQEEVSLIANRIVQSVSCPYLILDQHIEVTPSVGISIYPKDALDIESLMRMADKAMYFAKFKGKGNYQFYETSLEDFIPNESLVDKFLKWFKAK
ncbi:GGDEF domain-containing protein [Litchfieldia salsa]|uniref:PAS domain S-box-containing protein/diguanylate cyclase (GGDEF) domain-containing protein n=1 Tax=Litchfieldia salsa TaxID=930152 RepID=A0A1H0U8D8_9BACI|nr:GGDEF domain-containing protein [Litchfieldia salsa]SDP62421.1 PAS domain S-box-containing protein/diguanylate cyclase (GGDEF) domain-containing protein [Litchfieldia salsa]